MRRLLLLVALFAPLPAAAQDAFCTGLQRLVEQARWGFSDLGLGGRVLHGSVQERRGVLESPDGPARGAFFAIMLNAPSRELAAVVAPRFQALHTEIARCLPTAEGGATQAGQGGAVAVWRTPYAVVRLRREDGDGFASTAEIEVVVASRW